MAPRSALLGALLLAPPFSHAATPEAGAGHVTGIGGIFVKSKDPGRLAAWYRTVLGVKVERWGGAAFASDAPLHPPKAAWVALPEASTYTAPFTCDFMPDFAVDDLDAITARLTAHGVTILKRDDADPSGHSATAREKVFCFFFSKKKAFLPHVIKNPPSTFKATPVV